MNFPANLFESIKVLMAAPQGHLLGYHTPKQVSNLEPPDSQPCILTTMLLGTYPYMRNSFTVCQ